MLGPVETGRGAVSRPLGSTGLAAFPLALDGSIFGWASGPEETVDVLDRFSEAGGSVVSTADHYAGGRSEVMLGAWMRDRDRRDRMIVATKVGRHPDAPGLSAASIRRGVDASLRRLDTDRIDFLAFDGDHPETPIADSLGAIGQLISDGKVRHLTVSGYSPARLVELFATADELGLPRASGLFVEYNLMRRTPFETQLAALAAEVQLAVFARMPLASGYLAGVLRTREDLPTSVMHAAAREHVGRRGDRVLAAVEQVASELDGASLASVSLAWLLGKRGKLFPVLRAATVEQCDTCLAAAGLSLSRSQMLVLDRASA